MTRSRLRPGYSVSSRSRVVSSVARSGYGNPLLPRSRASSEYYTPISKSSGYYDSPTFDYAMDDTMSRSNYISSAAIDDFYDTSARSRGKDRRLLDETTTAIVSSETHASPRAAVASMRARSRVPGARSSGPVGSSSYQVKSTTLSSSSYPIVPQVAAGARQQPLASSAPFVIRARVRGIPGMVILPRARALLSARRAADLASYYRAVSPFRFLDARDDLPPSADDERVVAASYREAATMLARPRRVPVAHITPSPSPVLADYAKAHVMADRAIGFSRPRVRVADVSYRRLGLAPRYRKHAVLYYPGRSLVVPKRAHQVYYNHAAAFVKSVRPRPPSRKLPGKASRLQVSPKSMYARVVRAVLFGEPMPGAEDTLPDLPFISRMYRLPLPPGVRTRLIASLTPRRGHVPLPYFPFYPRHPHVYRPLFPLLYRSALPLSFPPRVIPSTTALALLLHLRDMQEPSPPPPRRSRKGKTSSARVRPKSRSKSKKAAIVASKLEMEEPRRRRPRSKFAADKLRSVRLESLETQRELGGPPAPLAKGDKGPMSETRRRLRRVIVRHRNDPHYYRE